MKHFSDHEVENEPQDEGDGIIQMGKDWSGSISAVEEGIILIKNAREIVFEWT